MGKILSILAAITVLFSATAYAPYLPEMTGEELPGNHQDISDEMDRGEPAQQESEKEENETEEVKEHILTFFTAWYANDVDKMLAMCDSNWKGAVENPRMELFRLLANRRPTELSPDEVSKVEGEDPNVPPCYLVTVIVRMDINNGTSTELETLQLYVRKEKDGLWYIDPTGLSTGEETDSEVTEVSDGSTETITADTVLYYNPEGGIYYHLDRDCKLINPKYLPLKGSFLYSELNEEPYRKLEPCNVCSAPQRPEAGGVPQESEKEENETTDAMKCAVEFFSAWHGNLVDGMLAVSDPDWKETSENPREELLRLMANQRPMECVPIYYVKMSEEGPDSQLSYLIAMDVQMDRNNGASSGLVTVQFVVRKGKDGLWYMVPNCIIIGEETDSEATEVPDGDTETITADTVLYYNPEGGTYYHLDQNCQIINPKYRPLLLPFIQRFFACIMQILLKEQY